MTTPAQPTPREKDRFTVTYRLSGGRDEAEAKARDLIVEQTVEFPPDLIQEKHILDHVVGRIENLEQGPDGAYRARVSFAADDVGGDFTQFLNVLFGNVSLKPGVKIDRLGDLGRLGDKFRGPRFGCEGLRERLSAPGRALLATAVKPMGLSAEDLAERAHHFALGGIDIIKDDHGLSDQPYAPFEERVKRCAEAVAEANKKTGYRCLYAPNVTAGPGETERRARFAKGNGAGALLVSPGLCGFDAMRALADDDTLGLPILAHPAFLGGFTASPESGISHGCLFGQLMRLSGADASIYPHAGGRFSFPEAECRSIALGCAETMGRLKPIFPAPGGGMTLKRGDELKRFYGADAVYLVGGDLLRGGPDIVKTCETFRRMVSNPPLHPPF